MGVYIVTHCVPQSCFRISNIELSLDQSTLVKLLNSTLANAHGHEVPHIHSTRLRT